jgi:hypothetical protein
MDNDASPVNANVMNVLRQIDEELSPATQQIFATRLEAVTHLIDDPVARMEVSLVAQQLRIPVLSFPQH